MHHQPAPTDPDEYATWINQRVGAEVRRRREALDISAYALAKDAWVSDQTILNIEQGTHVPLLSTLARICVRFGIRVTELMEAAEAE